MTMLWCSWSPFAQRGCESLAVRTGRVNAVRVSCCEISVSCSLRSKRIYSFRYHLFRSIFRYSSHRDRRRSYALNSVPAMQSQSYVPLVSLFCDIHDQVHRHSDSGTVSINGHSLNVAGVIAVARLVDKSIGFAMSLTG